MVTIIYEALQKVSKIFSLPNQVSFFSYKNDFKFLWELNNTHKRSENSNDPQKIWCVVDDGDSTAKRLHIGIWGRYYRARYLSKAPRLILIGREKFLNPKGSGGIDISIPDFYEDDGICTISLTAPDLISQIFTFVNKPDPKYPSEDLIEGFKALVYRTLTAEGSHHAVSNEIAPTVLAGAWGYSTNSKFDIESKALLKLWEWAASFLGIEKTTTKKKSINDIVKKHKSVDIWNVWSNARFLLIDDQAESHNYNNILKCALKKFGKNIELKSQSSINLDTDCDLDRFIDEIIRNYKCLFLDIRLGDKDKKENNYKKLTGIRIAEGIWEKDKSFPVVIFSSSQKREIENILSEYKNVVTTFRKPGVAGSLESINGEAALENLFGAIKESLEMIENRYVYKQFEKLKKFEQLAYKVPDGNTINLTMEWDRAEQLFEVVFLDKLYDKAFIYPYGHFEEKFDKNYHALNAIRLDENKPLCEIDWDDERTIFLIHLRMLTQMRNIASHRLRSFIDYRREAIIILMLFADTLLIKSQKPCRRCKDLNKKNLYNFLKSNPYRKKLRDKMVIYNPLIMPVYASNQKKVTQYIYEIFASVCYLIGSDLHEKMYTLWKMNKKEQSY